jgi:hypothetical protein
VTLTPLARFPRRPLPPFTLALLAFFAATAAGAVLAGDRVVLRLASSSERRASALERLVAKGDLAVLVATLESETDPVVRERALDLAPLLGSGAAAPLARSLERHVGLPDLRAVAALADERALPALGRLLRDRSTSHRERAATFTALAAVAARRHLDATSLPALAWSEHDLLEELALGVEEDAPPWRAAALRALARNLRVSPAVLARHRLRIRELEAATDDRLEQEEHDAERRGGLALLWLRGESGALARAASEDRALSGLLAPEDALARLREPGRLDDVLGLTAWGGAGEWRRLEALARDGRGRVALRSALERAPDRSRPAAAAAAILLRDAAPVFMDPPTLETLARSGALEELPPPLVLEALGQLGERAIPPLVRASGRLDGRLARVLEPGAGTARERLLLDLAVASVSTQARGCR